MRAAIAALSLVVAAVFPLARAPGGEPAFVGRAHTGAGGTLKGRDGNGPVLRKLNTLEAAVPVGVLDSTGRLVAGALAPLPGAARGDGGGADVDELIAIQVTYADPNFGNTVLLVWNENTANPPPLTLSMDQNVVATFPPRPGTASFPGTDAVRLANVAPGLHEFALDSEDGTFSETTILVLPEAPFGGVENLRCETGAFIGEGTCEVLLSWDDLSPLVDFHYAFLGTTPIARLPSNISGVVFQGSPGNLCIDLVSVTTTDEGLYAVQSQTCCDIQCSAQGCSEPVDLRFHQAFYSPGWVDVSWRNTGAPQGIIGFINGQRQNEQLIGDTTLASFTGLAAGVLNLGIQADCGEDGTSNVIFRDFEVLASTPFTNPIVGPFTFEYDEINEVTSATWVNGDPALFIEVYVDVAGDPNVRTFLGTGSPDITGLNINMTTATDVPVLVFYTVINGFCYASDPVVAVPLGSVNRFVRGLCNGQQPASLLTASFLFNYLFQNGGAPPCLEACDLDANDSVNLVDGLFLLNYLFQNGAVPVGWLDGDQDGLAEETCETATLDRCAESHDLCP
jgi:hypothetical protein